MIRILPLWALSYLSCFVTVLKEFQLELAQNIALAVAFSSASMWAFIYGRYLIFIRAKSEFSREGIFGRLILPAMTIYLFSLPVAGRNFFSWFYLVLIAAAIVVVWDPRMNLTKNLWSYRFHEFRDFPDDGIVGQAFIKKYKYIVYICAFVFPAAGVLVMGIY